MQVSVWCVRQDESGYHERITARPLTSHDYMSYILWRAALLDKRSLGYMKVLRPVASIEHRQLSSFDGPRSLAHAPQS